MNLMEKKYSESDIKKGIDIEMEHAETIKKFMRDGVTVKEVARAIAIDHLEESPTYYEDLKEEYSHGGGIDKNDTDIKVGENKFKVSIYLGDHSYDNETDKETPMWFCKVYKMNGNYVDGILTLDDDLDGYDIGNFDSRKKAKDFILEYKDELNIILRNDYGEPVNFFSYLSNPNIHFRKGGNINKKENLARIYCHNPKCNWSWKVKDGGHDLYICHKCHTDNEKYYEKGGSVDYSFYSGRGRRNGDEKKPEIFFVISNSIVGDLKLGDLFSTSIENEYETKTFLDVFHS